MTQQIQISMPDNIYDGFREAVSPFDAEAEPEDMGTMEMKLSETTEDDMKLTAEEQDECCGWPPKDDEGCCDMPLEEYDPEMSKSIQEEMEEMALAEPEPPEEDSNGKP